MLPQVIMLVTPLAAFGATIFSINKLFVDAEMIIVMSSGRSTLSLMHPILIFGAIITIFMYSLTLYIVPVTQEKLRDLMFEVKENVTNQLVRDGQFLHPSPGISIYIREANKSGQIKGIFLSDTRDIEKPTTYSAKEALLHKANDKMFFLMKKGLIQISNQNKKELMTVAFEQLSLNLDEFLPNIGRNFLGPEEIPPLKILYNFNDLQSIDKTKKNDYFAEAHLKLAMPLTCSALTILALTTFLLSSHLRRGFSLPIYVCIAVGLLMQSLTLSLKSVIAKDQSLFWVIYSPALLLFLSCFSILVFFERNRLRGLLK